MTSAHDTLNDCHVQEEKPEEINEEVLDIAPRLKYSGHREAA